MRATKPKQPKQPKQPKAGGPAVDPEKDKLLLAGFASSLRDVLGLGAQG